MITDVSDQPISYVFKTKSLSTTSNGTDWVLRKVGENYQTISRNIPEELRPPFTGTLVHIQIFLTDLVN